MLFTGRIAGETLEAAIGALEEGDLVLAHPAAAEEEVTLLQEGFGLSSTFLESSWRQREWHALKSRALREQSSEDDV